MADVSDVMKDVDGAYSSKRLGTLSGLALFAVGFLADTFTDYNMSQNLAELLMVIILGGMGLSVAERWQPGRAAAKPEETKP